MGYASVALIDDPLGPMMWVAAFLLGIGQASAIVSAGVLIGQVAPEGDKGTVFGTYGVAGSAGIVTLTFVGGLLFDAYGSRQPLYPDGRRECARGGCHLASVSAGKDKPHSEAQPAQPCASTAQVPHNPLISTTALSGRNPCSSAIWESNVSSPLDSHLVHVTARGNRAETGSRGYGRDGRTASRSGRIAAGGQGRFGLRSPGVGRRSEVRSCVPAAAPADL